jgi:hypothetical protein
MTRILDASSRLLSGNFDMRGTKPLLAAPMHHAVSALQMLRVRSRIEQRPRQTRLRELVLDRSQHRGAFCQFDRQAFKLPQCLNDQFRQSDLGQKACSYPARKAVADLRQHRQAGPQGVTCRGVGIIRQGIEKEICQAMPRQMVRR